MKKNLQDIDKLFREGLEDHAERAPAGVWDAVSNELDKRQALLFRQKYFRLKRVALVLLLLIFSGITYVFYSAKQNNKNSGIAQNQTTVATTNRVNHVASGATAATSNREKKTATGRNVQSGEPANTKETASSAAINSKEGIVAAEKPLADDATAYPPASVQEIPSTVSNDAPVKSKEAAAKDARLLTASNTSKIILPATDKRKKYLTGNNEPATLQKERPDERNPVAAGKRFTYNSHQQPGLSVSSNQQIYLTPGKSGKGHQYSNQYNLPLIKDAPLSALAGAPAGRPVTALAPYLNQSALLLPLFEPPVPGPFVEMVKAPFLNNVIENDSLKKAIAVSKIKKPSRHPISLMAFGSPNHSFTRLENDDQLSGPGRNKYAAEKDERQGASYSAGLLVNYGISKNFVLQSGLVFSSAKTNISPKVIYARPDNSGHTRYEFNCASGYSYITPKTGQQPAVGDSIQVMGSSSTISYIGIPVSLNYVLQKGRFSLRPGIGVSVNVLTGGNSATRFGNNINNQKEISSISGLKKAYVDGSVGLGAEWMLNRSISIGIRPLLRMALTAINKDTPVKTYQNYLSLETGLKINL